MCHASRAFVRTRPERERDFHPDKRAYVMATASIRATIAHAPASTADRRPRAAAVRAPARTAKISKKNDDSTRRGDACVAHATKETYASFDDMIENSSVPVLVDFYATWCGPCQMLSKDVLPKVAGAVGKDKVKLVKINTEKYPNIAGKYKVEALPTIMLFKDGNVADRIEGMPNAPQLIDRLLYFLQ
jgi:thioredoxin